MKVPPKRKGNLTLAQLEEAREKVEAGFPFLFGGTFIEGMMAIIGNEKLHNISLPFRRDFH